MWRMAVAEDNEVGVKLFECFDGFASLVESRDYGRYCNGDAGAGGRCVHRGQGCQCHAGILDHGVKFFNNDVD